MRNFLILSLLATIASQAANTLAVLEIISKSEIKDISIAEMRHLTDELRKQAVLAFPGEGYTVLTRDNMLALMPPDEAEAECLAESCAVEIGRAIGAEYISQGSLGRFGNELSISIELYETMSGKLLGSIVIENPDIKGLLVAIREQAPTLFARIKTSTNLKIENQKLGNSQLNPEFKSQKINTSTWIAVGFGVLGAAGLGFGIYQHFKATGHYNTYKNFPPEEWEDRKSEYKAEYKKVTDAQTARNISIVAGGVFLLSGITVHILF